VKLIVEEQQQQGYDEPCAPSHDFELPVFSFD
jgi:hypothetical protein